MIKLRNGEPLKTDFRISRERMEQRTCVKYLGAQIDNHMKRKDHATLVSPKVSQAIGMIKYAKIFLPIEIVLSRFDNGSAARFGAAVRSVPAEILRSYKIKP